MIPVKYKNLCPVCGGNITSEELENSFCQSKKLPLSSPFLLDREINFRKLFIELVGRPRNIQNFWLRRVVFEESFCLVAPTGIGKSTFGIITSLFFSLEGKKSYIIVPTYLLVKQTLENLKNLLGKSKQERLRKANIIAYHGKMKDKEKKEIKERIKHGDFDILITTTQFLVKDFSCLENKSFDFVFVDDVDALLKGSRNVDRILNLLGFRKEKTSWIKYKNNNSILIVSTATADRGKNTTLFRNLLGFDVGSSFFNIRNIDDVILDDTSLKKLKEILKELGPGGLIYTRDIDTAERLFRELIKEFKIGKVFSGKETSDYELFLEGKLDYLVGISHYYGKLVRGLDLPKRIRFTIFFGAPAISVRYKDLTPKMVKILALSLRKSEEIKRFLPTLVGLRENSKMFLELKETLEKILKKEKPEDIVIRDNMIIFPDIKTYLQGSGRCSRLTIGGLTKGISFLVEEDKELLSVFTRRATYYNLFFKKWEEIDFSKIKKELDQSREEKSLTFDLIRPALFVVESPTKAKQIARFFGKPSKKYLEGLIIYEVASEKFILLITACLGHILDLTSEEAFWGVEVNDKFVPIYTTIKRCKTCMHQFTKDLDSCPRCGNREIDDSRKRIESLRKIAYQAGYVIIGTDPDAEGEKIAWDIANVLKGLGEIRRIEFHEVTPLGIRRAFGNLRAVDENMVKAQIVRRVEDRWIGFFLSQRLQRILKNKNISAGRVQSPVLSWIIEREKKFKEKKIIGYCKEFDLSFENIKSKTLEVFIELIEEKEEEKTPLPPYSTDELLKDANRFLKRSVVGIMKLTQDLFEQGLITYHRTDSIHVSKIGQDIARDYLGDDFYGREWAKEGTHECIRPTRAWDKFTLQRMIYEKVFSADKLTKDHILLYDLIFRRFVSSQAKNFKVKIRKYRISYEGADLIEERVEKAEGKAFQLYKSVKVKPSLPLGKSTLDLEIRSIPLQYPYSEAEIVKDMKERRIGRPSTYSSIVERLFLRKYIRQIKDKGWLFSTSLGRKVCNLLYKNWKEFVEEERTRDLLEKMDKIEEAYIDYQEVLKEVYREITSTR